MGELGLCPALSESQWSETAYGGGSSFGNGANLQELVSGHSCQEGFEEGDSVFQDGVSVSPLSLGCGFGRQAYHWRIPGI
jgi:hypothetical protein